MHRYNTQLATAHSIQNTLWLEENLSDTLMQDVRFQISRLKNYINGIIGHHPEIGMSRKKANRLIMFLDDLMEAEGMWLNTEICGADERPGAVPRSRSRNFQRKADLISNAVGLGEKI